MQIEVLWETIMICNKAITGCKVCSDYDKYVPAYLSCRIYINK